MSWLLTAVFVGSMATTAPAITTTVVTNEQECDQATDAVIRAADLLHLHVMAICSELRPPDPDDAPPKTPQPQPRPARWM